MFHLHPNVNVKDEKDDIEETIAIEYVNGQSPIMDLTVDQYVSDYSHQNSNDIAIAPGDRFDADIFSIKMDPESESNVCELESVIKIEEETFSVQFISTPQDESNSESSSESTNKHFSCKECDFWCNRRYILADHNSLMHSKPNKRFSCTYCVFQTDFKFSLQRHTLMHLREQKYSCSLCEFTCVRQIDFSVHKRSFHSDEDFRVKSLCCTQCHVKFTSKLDLEEHLTTYGHGGYCCAHCDYKTNSKLNIRRHLVGNHLMEKLYQCSRCHYKSDSLATFKCHRNVHKNEKFQCAHCDGYKTTFKWNLKQHIMGTHFSKRSFSCFHCDYKTDSRESLKLHRKSHKIQKPCDSKMKNRKVPAIQKTYLCSQCNFECNHNATLRAHEKTHSIEQSKELQCEHCDFKTLFKYNLKRHMANHGSVQRMRIHSCLLCTYQTTRRCHLKWHNQRIHLGEEPFRCIHCNLTFSTRGSLFRHTKTHFKDIHGIKCLLCDYKTLQRSTLNAHMKTHSKVTSIVKCSECNFTTFRESNLKNHMKKHSQKQREFHFCTECDYKTIHKRNLSTHIKIHSKVAYSCSKCNYKTKRLFLLNHHESLHSEQRAYTCAQCDYRTIRLSHFKKHMTLHSSLKLYSCAQCKFKTIWIASFRKHVIKHTKDKMYFCSKCEFKTPLYRHLKKHIIANHIK